jgi:RNA polymerase sigma factor (sigma-70 family)
LSESFPATRFSIVRATGSADPLVRREAWDALVRAYWRPVYTFVRLRWHASTEDAQDYTQEFFARAFEAGFFEDFDPTRARFRTYLRLCLQRFLGNAHKAAVRQKRGGDVRLIPLDFASAEGDVRRAAEGAEVLDEESFFRRESVRSLFALAIEDLRAFYHAAGKSVYFDVFARYDLEDPGAGERPTYRQIAEACDLPVTQVTNYLAHARRELRRIVLDRLREISGTEAEFREEAHDLLGMDPP